MERPLRFNQGKLDWTLIPFDALEEVVKVLEMGAVKYGRNNYQLDPGLPLESYIQSSFRHLIELTKGELLDKESELNHFSHVAANALMYLWTLKTYHSDLNEVSNECN